MKNKQPPTEMMAGMRRDKPLHLAREQLAIGGAAEATIAVFKEDLIDERRIYARSIVREIERDGCVRGSLGSDPT